MSTASHLRLRCPAQSHSVAPIRHALRAFLEAIGVSGDCLDDVTTAAGEALANAVEHAYREDAGPARFVELHARIARGKLAVDISDGGTFIERERLPGRGFGLRIMRAVTPQFRIDTGRGTSVRMRFRLQKS
ncbi:MAG TPA: ATP-binding protein [Candidatus Cybelea sp.]|jgi:anti-sigma regulatory factor (Ser/Thr protein kinase)|nr:ATP-binding protein [Candidatus Cybelea sp.]